MRRTVVTKASRRVLLGALILLAIFPIIWLISSSIKSRLEILAYPPKFLWSPTLEAYQRIFSGGEGSKTVGSLVNSLIIALGSTGLGLMVASLASFSFSRYSFSGRRTLMFFMLLSRLLPPITAVIPLFFMLKTMQLIDSRIGLMLIYAALNTPFGVWLMKAFFDGIPVELEESAMVDGCSRLGSYLRITVPLAAPGLAATSIFLFVLGWNEFMFAFIFTSVKARPMTVLLAQATLGEYQIYWTDMAAMASIQVLPILIFSLIVQKHLVRGLTAGALK